jgi:hypothetical protein
MELEAGRSPDRDLFQQAMGPELWTCNGALRTSAFAAITAAKLNGSRSVEALELTNAQALVAVITAAPAMAAKRLNRTLRILMTIILVLSG